MTTENKPFITPDIKIYDLLEAFPQLEDKLIEIAPVFIKLKNPILRKTIAKVTTLKQASVVGKMSLAELIGKLRSHVNQGDDVLADEKNVTGYMPSWVSEDKVTIVYDAREDLENNVHPINRVVKETNEMTLESVYLLITPFTPAPLIDLLLTKGFETYSKEKAPGQVFTFIKKQNPC